MANKLEPPVIEKIDKNSLLNGDVKEQEPEKINRELSAFEQKMINHGWNPEGELSAEDWIDNGFKVKNKKLDSLFSTIEKMKERYEMAEKDAYARAKADLEAQRIEAIEMADVKRVKEIERQSQELIDPSVKEHVDAFKTKHSAWLNGTSFREREMQMICGNKDQELFSMKLNPEQHFEQLESYMKEKYPDYFGLEPKPVPNAVAGGQPQAVKQTAKKKMTFDDLDDFQKKAALNLQKSKGISIDDYIKRLIELDNR